MSLRSAQVLKALGVVTTAIAIAKPVYAGDPNRFEALAWAPVAASPAEPPHHPARLDAMFADRAP